MPPETSEDQAVRLFVDHRIGEHDAHRHTSTSIVTSAKADPGREPVLTVTALAGAFMLAAGVWRLASPSSFADFTNFAAGSQFVHDAGAFQLGIGAALLLALCWRDGLAKVRRIRNNHLVEVGPCTTRGKPKPTGPAIHARQSPQRRPGRAGCAASGARAPDPAGRAGPADPPHPPRPAGRDSLFRAHPSGRAAPR
jgi:hypothetical protein